MISGISSANDNIYRPHQSLRAFLSRSDYPDLYNPDHLQAAFADGWKHFYDEPDLLHKTTDRGMTFALHPAPPNALKTGPFPKPYVMTLHSPEGVSYMNAYDTLPQAMKVQNEIAKDPSKIQTHLKPNPWQQMYVNSTSPNANDVLNAMKASEEAIAMGGDNLYNNTIEARRRRGVDAL